jgi:hypothetical protein
VERLLSYQAVLYDANIIIYYCFYSPVRLTADVECVVDAGAMTDTVRRISERLRKEERMIRTIRIIMDEITDTVLADAVKRRVSEEEVRQELGLVRGMTFPKVLELQIVEKCRKTTRKIQASSWFAVDEFEANTPELNGLKQYYRNVAADPMLRARFRLKGVMPSEPDLHLMAYSRSSGLPVLSDDGHFVVLRAELKSLGFVTEIVPLRSVSIRN